MPLVKRPIPSSLSLAAPELYSESRGNEVLDDVNMAGMVGTLTQLGALAVYAHEMFSERCSVADELAGRVVEISSHTSKLMADLTRAEEVTARVVGKEMGIDDNAVVEAMKAERQAATRTEAATAQTVFLARTMPPGLVERYHSSEVRPMPALAEIDALISNKERQRMRQERGVESCTQLYSAPTSSTTSGSGWNGSARTKSPTRSSSGRRSAAPARRRRRLLPAPPISAPRRLRRPASPPSAVARPRAQSPARRRPPSASWTSGAARAAGFRNAVAERRRWRQRPQPDGAGIAGHAGGGPGGHLRGALLPARGRLCGTVVRH
ncbi:unnamed protein product, partial [Phaeothamnion confervicola]